MQPLKAGIDGTQLTEVIIGLILLNAPHAVYEGHRVPLVDYIYRCHLLARFMTDVDPIVYDFGPWAVTVHPRLLCHLPELVFAQLGQQRHVGFLEQVNPTLLLPSVYGGAVNRHGSRK